MRLRPIAIVDPYSSGAMLAAALGERGVPCVGIEAYPQMPAAMKSKFRPADFLEVISHTGNLDATLRAVRRHDPAHVMAGFDSGVELAEQLAHRLGLPANGNQPDARRWHKYAMAACVAESGLRTPWQRLAISPEEASRCAASLGRWPVVVKPVRSVASDGVTCCRDEAEVARVANDLLARANILGRANRELVIQEYLPGTEYIVDTVSWEGRRKVTAIWQYGRRDPEIELGYDRMELVAYDGARQRRLTAFASACLDALEVRFGPAHCEIMWANDEPVLIEMGARMSAGINATLSRMCGGICQLDETVRVLLDPAEFLATLEDSPQLTRCGMNVFLSPQNPGRLRAIHGLEDIRALRSVHSLSAATTIGEPVGRVAGRVTLIARDRTALEADVARIDRLQQQGIFETEAE